MKKFLSILMVMFFVVGMTGMANAKDKNSSPKDTRADNTLEGTYDISLQNRTGNNTWTFSVSEQGGKSLSHWAVGFVNANGDLIQIPDEYITGTAGPQGTQVDVGTDGSTGFEGIKWDLNEEFTNGDFSFTIDYEKFTADYGTDLQFKVLAKAGNAYETYDVADPVFTEDMLNQTSSDIQTSDNTPAETTGGQTETPAEPDTTASQTETPQEPAASEDEATQETAEDTTDAETETETAASETETSQEAEETETADNQDAGKPKKADKDDDTTPQDTRADNTLEGTYDISLLNRTGNNMWTFSVSEQEGKSLSHWAVGFVNENGDLVEIPKEYITSTTGPGSVDVGVDGSTGFNGIKWDLEEGFTSGDFSFTIDYDRFTADYGTDVHFKVLAKAGNAFETYDVVDPVFSDMVNENTTDDFENAVADNTPSTGQTATPAPVGGSASAVPEPATMVLLGSGLAGLAGLRRKFFKKS